MANEFKNETMNGNIKVTEIVSYKGELRIIGQVIDIRDNKTLLGYVIMVEKTRKFKIYTVDQTKILLSRFKFVNAELKDDNITNTECSMDKILKFDSRMNVIDNFGITVLAEIYSGDEAFGYRAMDKTGKIIDIRKEDLLSIVSSGIDLLNAKVVTRGGKSYISGIKDSFTRIDKSTTTIDKPKELSEADKWRHKIHIDKLVYKWAPKVLRNSMCVHQTSYFPWGLLAYHTGKKYDSEHIHFGKLINIFRTEILSSYVKTKEEAELLKKVLNLYSDKIDKEMDYRSERKNQYNKLMAVALCQFLSSDEKFCHEVLRLPRETSSSGLYDELHKQGLTTKSFDALYLRMKKAYKDKETTINDSRRKPFDTITFGTTAECAQLGFAINSKDEGIKYTTACGSTYKLKYIGDYIDNYAKYKSMANCLGDVLCLAQIERTIEVDYFTDDEKLARIETILAIMSMYRPDIVKTYLEDNEDKFERYGFLPGLDLNSRIDYKLSKELKIYYESGFNVFLSDQGMYGALEHKYYNQRNYTRYRLKNAKYINYRGLSAGIKCMHDMLYNELAPVVAMITSDNVNTDTLNSIIGCLRVL